MEGLLTSFSEDITAFLWPLASALGTIILTFWVKDYAIKVAKGLSFRFDKDFKEGDHVILDDEESLIVKNGMSKTVFGTIKPDGTYVWRYVSNDRIPFLKLEKVIFDKEQKATLSEKIAEKASKQVKK